MSLRLFFNQFTEEEVQIFTADSSIASSIEFHFNDFPNWEEAEIAIISIEEYRFDTKHPQPESATFKSASSIRKSLYQLKSVSKELKIVDLGCLRLGVNSDETIERLSEVCSMLLKHDTLPLIIGGDHELDFAQFLAYQDLEKMLAVVNVDATIDMTLANKEKFGHVQRILLHHPNYLFDYTQLGYQRYFVDLKVLETFQKLNFELKSIGQMRDRFEDIEPLVRSADMLSFDVTAIRNAEMPLKTKVHPFGLTGEEACQLSWYAGTNEKLTSVGFYGLDADIDENSISAKVISTMIWYFIEGFAHRKKEYSFKSNFHIKYIVPLAAVNEKLPVHNLVFYKSKITDKWWMEIPVSLSEMKEFGRNIIIPCSYADYEIANTGNIPDRWLKAMEKYS